jgi:hypothetical protein
MSVRCQISWLGYQALSCIPCKKKKEKEKEKEKEKVIIIKIAHVKDSRVEQITD